VIERINCIDSVLPADDGVACRNHLHLNVTGEIRTGAAPVAFGDIFLLEALV
jgi:hypothetical protein